MTEDEKGIAWERREILNSLVGYRKGYEDKGVGGMIILKRILKIGWEGAD